MFLADKHVGIGLLVTFAGAGLVYWAFLYALNRTSLQQRVKRHGCYGCPRYRHSDIVWGSDFPKRLSEAVANGQRQAWIRDQFAKYGQTFEFNQWGKRMFYTCDPINIQSMLSTQFGHFGLGPSRIPARPWLGKGIFTADGEIWKSSRALLKPIFTKAEISDMARLDKHLQRLLGRLAEMRYEADLQGLFLNMASYSSPTSHRDFTDRRVQYLDYSIDLLFGDDVNTIAGESTKIDADAFIAACDASLLQVARSQTPWLLRWYRGWTKTWNQPFLTSQAFVDQHVDAALKRKEHGVEGSAFVDGFVQQTGSTDRLYLRNQMLNIFFPARDASGIAISLVMFQLSRHPVVYAKVRAEVLDRNFGNGITYEGLKDLRYINAVISETLRLHGPTGHALRDVLVDTVLPRGGGLERNEPMFVPKGSALVAHMHAIQRDQSAWGEDADSFRPERWLEDSKSAQRRGWEYLPFLGGPRVCPGQPMVLAQSAYIVVAFALRFREIQNCDPEEKLVEEHRILMKIRNGVLVKLVP